MSVEISMSDQINAEQVFDLSKASQWSAPESRMNGCRLSSVPIGNLSKLTRQQE